MSWQRFVAQTIGSDQQKDAAWKAGVDQSAISRWMRGGLPKAEQAVKFARGYKVSPVAALVAAGFLTEREARVRPAAMPRLEDVTDDQLVELIRTRLKERGSDGTPMKTPLSAVPARTDRAIAADEQELSIAGEQEQHRET